jgi:hypothetical protein
MLFLIRRPSVADLSSESEAYLCHTKKLKTQRGGPGHWEAEGRPWIRHLSL